MAASSRGAVGNAHPPLFLLNVRARECAMPTYFSDNNNPRRGDPRWRILEKIVGELYATAPQANTAPARRDTRWRLLRKWNALRDGVPLP